MEKLKLILLDEKNGIYREYPIRFVGEYPKSYVAKLIEEGAKDLIELYLSSY